MRYGRVIIGTLIAAALSCFPFPLKGQDVIEPDAEDLLKESLENDDLTAALQYVNILNQRDTMSILALLNCADYYIDVQKYQECIDFCNKWSTKMGDSYDGLFDREYGQSYYFLSDYKCAAKYLKSYILWCDENDLNVGSFDYGLYSECLYETQQYKPACKYFEKYFSIASEEENTTIDRLYLSKWKESHGYKFYDYAFSCFFLGNESKGNTMLEYSSKCGNKYAKADLAVLQNCYTYNSSFDIKRRIYDEFDQYIAKYDIKNAVKDISNENPRAFWDALVDNSVDYRALGEAMNRERRPKTLDRAIDELNSSKSELVRRLALCSPYAKSEFEEGLEGQLYGKVSPIYDFRVYPSDDVNAFATPYGQIYLTDAIVKRFNFNPSLLMGVCAHETTHYMCQHSLTSLWQSAEKTRKNEIWGGIAAGVSAIAMGAAGMYAASNGVSMEQDYWDNIAKISTGLMDSFAEDAFLFKFKYSRNQEIESDIIAYRFCEWLGIGGYSYIMALQMLGDDDVYLRADSTSDHPTTTYRVLLLKYLFEKDQKEAAIALQNEDIKWLYDKLTEAGSIKNYSFDQFRESLKKDAAVRQAYDSALKADLNVGTYEEFYKYIKVN